MSFDEDFDYPDQQGIVHVVAKAGDHPPRRTVLASHGPLRRQQSAVGAFAPERQGNKVKAFTTGEAYFEDVAQAIQAATKSVFIAGWQVNWAVRLTEGVRLIDALHKAVQNGAKVYVMPWQSPKAGVNTGDLGTMLAVFQLNAGREQLQAFCCPAGLQNDLEGIEETFFSHHQKLVVVDGRIAYVGGIDLAFGRCDDASFSLAHDWRKGPEVYNTGVPPLHDLLPAEAVPYVDESELLRTTLAVGPMRRLLEAESTATQGAADSRAGRAVDAVANWWRTPIDWNQQPRWIREPVRLVRKAGDVLTEPVQDALDRSQQAAADLTVRKLDAGMVENEHVSAVVNTARAVIRATYNALLGISWLNERPNPDVMKPGSQSAPPGNATYLPDQPRMPWQDVHMRIEGPSVYDLARNFRGRWNSVQKAYLLGVLERHTELPEDLLPPKPAEGKGNGGTGGAMVRVLRSAPLTLVRQELEASGEKVGRIARQHEIHDAMVAAIRRAERFVYIENQFFQTEFGEPSINAQDESKWSGPMQYLMAQPSNRITAAITRLRARNKDLMPKNKIGRALGDRIEHAIRWGQPFHAYIVLPVHPEGSLADLAIVGQIHWTLQSLVYGSESLVNRVRLALYAKQECKEPRNAGEWEAAKAKGLEQEDGQPRFDGVIPREAIANHLTLLNLRSCQTTGGRVRTEQVYVHSKLLIVDDRIAIMGSANINDRSLAGGRDSELAVCVTDLDRTTAPIDGRNPIHVRSFAHELRKSLWRKHFALSGSTDVVKPASDLAALIDKPADPSTWQAIQAQAASNTNIYARHFKFVPTGRSSIWPVWKGGATRFPEGTELHERRKKANEQLRSYKQRMPFSKEFWESGVPVSKPHGIKGYVCALPIEWTLGENNHPNMNLILLTQIEPVQGPGDTRYAAANSSDTPAKTT